MENEDRCEGCHQAVANHETQYGLLCNACHQALVKPAFNGINLMNIWTAKHLPLIGNAVRLQGLQVMPQYNGAAAEIVDLRPADQWIIVRLTEERFHRREIGVKFENLEVPHE